MSCTPVAPFAPRHLRAIIEREERAERDLIQARAKALGDLLAQHGTPDAGAVVAAICEAHVEQAPSVARARTRLVEARVERRMAEHLLRGDLRDPEGDNS
jgi:hypothetical protein